MRRFGSLILIASTVVSCGSRSILDAEAQPGDASGGNRGNPSAGAGGVSSIIESRPDASAQAGSSFGGGGVAITDATLSFEVRPLTDARDAFSIDARDASPADAPIDSIPNGDSRVPDVGAPSSTWIERFGGTVNQNAYGLGVQSDGTLFVGGSFQGEIDFGDGKRTSVMDSEDAFAASFDTNGAIRWSKPFGDPGSQAVLGVAAVAAGGVALTGRFSGEIDFGGGPLPSGGNYDLFVSRLDDQGRYVSGVRFGNNGNQYGQAVAVTPQLKLVSTGFFGGSLDPLTNLVSAGGVDVFFLGFSSAADRLWAKSYGNALLQRALGIATHSDGSIVIVGEFSGQIDFGLGNLTSTTASDRDVFVAYFNADGNIVWAKRFGSTGDQAALGVAIDGVTNRIAITGSFANELDFGCGAMQSPLPSTYEALLDTDGNSKISVAWQGVNGATARAIAFTPQHVAIAVAEAYQSPDDAGPTGSWPVILGITDSNFTVATPFAAWTPGGGFQSPNAIGVDAAGNLYVAGTFTQWIELAGRHLVAAGAHDIFLAKVEKGTF